MYRYSFLHPSSKTGERLVPAHIWVTDIFPMKDNYQIACFTISNRDVRSLFLFVLYRQTKDRIGHCPLSTGLGQDRILFTQPLFLSSVH